MTGVIDRPPTTDPSRSTGWLSRAWFAVVLIPIFFIAFAAAEGVYSLTGYDPSTRTAPHWADIAALVLAGLIFALPCAAALIYGRRAIGSGQNWCHPGGYRNGSGGGLSLLCVLS